MLLAIVVLFTMFVTMKLAEVLEKIFSGVPEPPSLLEVISTILQLSFLGVLVYFTVNLGIDFQMLTTAPFGGPRQ